jgi:hypothetical protein
MMIDQQLDRLTQAVDEEDWERALQLLEAMELEAERLKRALHYAQHAQGRHQQRQLGSLQ